MLMIVVKQIKFRAKFFPLNIQLRDILRHKQKSET